jgi:hypothetical protein
MEAEDSQCVFAKTFQAGLADIKIGVDEERPPSNTGITARPVASWLRGRFDHLALTGRVKNLNVGTGRVAFELAATNASFAASE